MYACICVYVYEGVYVCKCKGMFMCVYYLTQNIDSMLSLPYTNIDSILFLHYTNIDSMFPLSNANIDSMLTLPYANLVGFSLRKY